MILENHEVQKSLAPQSKSVPNFQDHGNKGDLFSQQLKEIDKDLGIYEDPFNAADTDSISNKEASPLFDLENFKNSLEVNPGLPPQHFPSSQNHKESNTLLDDITNSFPHHVDSEILPQAKWKRLQRVPKVLTGTKTDQAGSKHPISLVIDQRESPSKKSLTMIKKVHRCWRRLVPSPTRPNEFLSLELQGAWEPPSSSRACENGTSKSTLCRVFS